MVTITELDNEDGYLWGVWCDDCERQLGIYGCIGDAEAMQTAHTDHHGTKMRLNPDPLKAVPVKTCIGCRMRAPWCKCGKGDYR